MITHCTYCICIIYEPWAVTSNFQSMVVFHSCCSFEFKSFLCISPHCCLRSFSYFKQKIRTNNKSERRNWFRKKMKVNCFICINCNFNRNNNKVLELNSNDLKLKCVLPQKKLFKYLIAANRRLFCGNYKSFKTIGKMRWLNRYYLQMMPQRKRRYLFGKQLAIMNELFSWSHALYYKLDNGMSYKPMSDIRCRITIFHVVRSHRCEWMSKQDFESAIAKSLVKHCRFEC